MAYLKKKIVYLTCKYMHATVENMFQKCIEKCKAFKKYMRVTSTNL